MNMIWCVFGVAKGYLKFKQCAILVLRAPCYRVSYQAYYEPVRNRILFEPLELVVPIGCYTCQVERFSYFNSDAGRILLLINILLHYTIMI